MKILTLISETKDVILDIFHERALLKSTYL
jgi:hypothetical protein